MHEAGSLKPLRAKDGQRQNHRKQSFQQTF